MLKIVFSLSDLNFADLMGVYEESNRKNADELYGDIDRNLALLNIEQDFYQYLDQVFFNTDGAFYALWLSGDTYVSALRMEPYHDGFLLEALETAQHYRGNGYAKTLIQSVCSLLGERDVSRVYSHVSKDNTVSLKTHFACGFQKTLNYAEYIDGTVRGNSYTMRFDCK